MNSQGYNKPTTGQERTHQTRSALSFCAYTVREKETTTTHKERGQDQDQKPSSQEDKPRKAGKEIKAGAKRTKRKANTRAKGQNRGQERGQKRIK